MIDPEAFVKAASELRPFMDKVELPEEIEEQYLDAILIDHKRKINGIIKYLRYLAAQEQKKN